MPKKSAPTNLMASAAEVPFSSLKPSHQLKIKKFLTHLNSSVTLIPGVKLRISLEAAIASLPMDGSGGKLRALLSRSLPSVLSVLTDMLSSPSSPSSPQDTPSSTELSQPSPSPIIPFTTSLPTLLSTLKKSPPPTLITSTP